MLEMYWLKFDVCGCVYARLFKAQIMCVGICVLHQVCVSESMRGRGLASRVVQDAIHHITTTRPGQTL
jgi:predicted GNAT family N-acyltransferase